jgi:FAD:protein FMN transferase
VAGELERSFGLFGSRVRLLIGEPRTDSALAPEIAAAVAEAKLRHLHDELTRFDPRSSLSRLNADPRARVAVSAPVALLVSAAIEAGKVSGGLVDATLIDALEDCGYAVSRAGEEPASLAEALRADHLVHPAGPSPKARWREIELDFERRLVKRPPGLRIDSGGLGKGLAADLIAQDLVDYASFAVDCGGDLRIGGRDRAPRQVEVDNPFGPGDAASFELVRGGIATSGLRTRLWRSGDRFAHHLIDPATGAPAWTGLVQVTAIAPTATEAEVSAKAALLEGAPAARLRLARHGGVLVHDSGEVELVGEPAGATVTAPARAAVA